MPVSPLRVILDTNVMVRGIGNRESPSGRILDLCDRRLIVPLVSRPVMNEYREILGDPEVTRHYPAIDAEMVDLQLERLAYLGDMMRHSRVRFNFPRDPKDAKFIELAIAGGASAIITCDRDLLSLRTGIDETSKRFRRRLPRTELLPPDVFLDWFLRPLAN